MAEWSKAPDSKSGIGVTLSGVRIPISPFDPPPFDGFGGGVRQAGIYLAMPLRDPATTPYSLHHKINLNPCPSFLRHALKNEFSKVINASQREKVFISLKRVL